MALHRARSTLLAAATAATVATNAHAQSPNEGLPIPETPKQSLTAIERAFSQPAPPPLTLFPQIREQLQDTPAFVRDSKVGFNFRSYYRDQVANSPTGTPINEAWAGGGWIGVESGRLFDRLWGGAVVYTSFPIYAPIDRDGTGLLKPGQEGFAVAGQLYGRLRLVDDHIITGGRYFYDTPFIGPQDNRMAPKTFYGYTLTGTFGDPAGDGPSFRYGGGYIATIKERNSDVFISMSRQAGAVEDRGTGVLGGRLTWGPASLGAIEYYTQDTINIAYAEGKYGVSFTPDFSAIAALQYADQRSTGTNLLNGGSYFSTGQFGAQAKLGYKTGIFTAGYTVVDPGFAMQTPWSANPFYTDAQINAFNRAGENAFVLGLSTHFGGIGIPSLAASVFYFRGWTSAPAAGAPLVEDEWNFDLEWKADWKQLQGLSLRARYGKSNLYQGGVYSTIDEVRLILNYGLKIY